MAEIKLNVVGYDHIIQEKGNTYISLRQVTWKEGSEPKIDIRKYMTNSQGDEVIGKGVCISDEGAGELAICLCQEGYGDTTKIIYALKDREDFNTAIRGALDGKSLEELQAEYSDMDLSSLDDELEETFDIREEIM